LPSPLPEVGKFTAGPPGTADAVLASDKDKPAAPNTGRALLRRFRFEACFEFDIVESSIPRWAGQLISGSHKSGGGLWMFQTRSPAGTGLQE
jgi:hypothetical protein